MLIIGSSVYVSFSFAFSKFDKPKCFIFFFLEENNMHEKDYKK